MVGVAVGVLALSTYGSGPATAGTVTARFFGLHAPGLPYAFPQAAVGSVDLTTNGVYWPQLETAPGEFDFSHLDAVVDEAVLHGAKPLLVLGQTPSFYSAAPDDPRAVATMPDLAAWRRYVWTVADRYGSSIDYQIWPEPNAAGNFTGTTQELATLVASASRVIHGLAPQAIVVSPALVIRKSYQRRYMDQLFRTRVAGKRLGHYVDAVALDAYPLENGTPEDSFAVIRQGQRILRKYRVDAPVWNVEINYGVVGGPATTYHYSDGKQAAYVVRNDVLDAAAGVQRVYWLGWFPFSQGAIQFVRDDEVTPTAAASALTVVRRWLINQHVRSCVENERTHVWTCHLVRDGRDSWVYWSTHGRAYVKAPPGSRHVESVSAGVIRTRAGKRLTVTGSPVRVYH